MNETRAGASYRYGTQHPLLDPEPASRHRVLPHRSHPHLCLQRHSHDLSRHRVLADRGGGARDGAAPRTRVRRLGPALHRRSQSQQQERRALVHHAVRVRTRLPGHLVVLDAEAGREDVSEGNPSCGDRGCRGWGVGRDGLVVRCSWFVVGKRLLIQPYASLRACIQHFFYNKQQTTNKTYTYIILYVHSLMPTHKNPPIELDVPVNLAGLSDTIRAFAGIVRLPEHVDAEDQAWKHRIDRQA